MFTLITGGTIKGIGERLEKDGNVLLAGHPGIDIRHVVSVPTSSGLTAILVFYENGEKKKK